MLEYQGPTVSARFAELHDLVELGLGIHRRLNELARKEKQPEVGYPEVSFWYLINHLGKRFLKELPGYLPGVQQLANGLWRAHVFAHPVFLVSVQELAVEHDSLPLHVLAGVPEADRGAVTAALKAEPALWPNYGAWLSLHQPALWQEIAHMVAQQQGSVVLNFGPFIEHLKQTGSLKGFLEAIGARQAVEAVGVKQAIEAMGAKQVVEAIGARQAVEAIGIDRIWETLSPAEREELLRRGQQDGPK